MRARGRAGRDVGRSRSVAPVAYYTIATMRVLADSIHEREGRDDLRLAEAVAAAAYWSAWSPVSVRFARRDLERVPTHWRTFGSRTSPLTGRPRLAANSANAILNYLYALLEGETTIAARVIGLDPGLGVMHADQLNRDSLAADLLEPVRPIVDRYVLELLPTRSFAPADFHETRQGVCRVTLVLASELAQTGHAGRARSDESRKTWPGCWTSAPAIDGSQRRSAGATTRLLGRTDHGNASWRSPARASASGAPTAAPRSSDAAGPAAPSAWHESGRVRTPAPSRPLRSSECGRCAPATWSRWARRPGLRSRSGSVSANGRRTRGMRRIRSGRIWTCSGARSCQRSGTCPPRAIAADGPVRGVLRADPAGVEVPHARWWGVLLESPQVQPGRQVPGIVTVRFCGVAAPARQAPVTDSHGDMTRPLTTPS